MTGVMDEIAIFDEALPEKDIQAIMNNGLQSAILAVSPTGSLTTTWGRVKEF